MGNCDCGAVNEGKWADIHSKNCALLNNNGWLPIAWAPKDGTRILIIDMSAPTPEPDIGSWRADNEGRVGWITYLSERVVEWLPTPTHWTELPNVPVQP